MFYSAPLALNSALGNFFLFLFFSLDASEKGVRNILSRVAEQHSRLLSAYLKFKHLRVILYLKELQYLLVQIESAFVKYFVILFSLFLYVFILSSPYANVLIHNSLQDMTEFFI